MSDVQPRGSQAGEGILYQGHSESPQGGGMSPGIGAVSFSSVCCAGWDLSPAG